MKALFIGGTGTISTAITEKLAKEGKWELYLINRGNNNSTLPENVNIIKADINECVVEKVGRKWTLSVL